MSCKWQISTSLCACVWQIKHCLFCAKVLYLFALLYVVGISEEFCIGNSNLSQIRSGLHSRFLGGNSVTSLASISLLFFFSAYPTLLQFPCLMCYLLSWKWNVAFTIYICYAQQCPGKQIQWQLHSTLSLGFTLRFPLQMWGKFTILLRKVVEGKMLLPFSNFEKTLEVPISWATTKEFQMQNKATTLFPREKGEYYYA